MKSNILKLILLFFRKSNNISCESSVRWFTWNVKSCFLRIKTQRAHDVNITSPQRRCNVMTLHRRWGDVIFSSCACRESVRLDISWHVKPYISLKNKIILWPWSCWTWIYPAFANSVDPDHLASEEFNWSGSALFVIQYVNLYQQWGSSKLIGVGLGGSVGCAIRLETRRSWVQPLQRSATFFRGDWSWNIFYGHSLPSADSRRAVVSFWRKNVHNAG